MDKDLKAAFAKFDTDGDGFLSAQELLHVLTRPTSEGKHMTAADANRWFKKMDLNHDGKVDYAEFARTWTNVGHSAPKRHSISDDAAERRKKLEDHSRSQHELLEHEREEKIHAREEVRKQHQAEYEEKHAHDLHSKYKKSEVMMYRKVFDEYDEGHHEGIDLHDFMDKIKKEVEAAEAAEERERRLGGHGVTHDHKVHAAHEAKESARMMLSVAEPLFAAVEHGGRITFLDMLHVIYPHANAEDRALFKQWSDEAVVAARAAVPVPRAKQYTPEQVAEIKAMFNMYDGNHDGKLTVNELIKALCGEAATAELGVGGAASDELGMSLDEVTAIFAQFDYNKDSFLDLREFTDLMESTGLWAPE